MRAPRNVRTFPSFASRCIVSLSFNSLRSTPAAPGASARVPAWPYRAVAIQSWGSRRTKLFAKGKRRLFPDQIEGKIERLLEYLDRGVPLDALESVGCQIHRLKGDRKGAYAIAVSGSRRIVFRLGEDEHGEAIVYDVEVIDYHKN